MVTLLKLVLSCTEYTVKCDPFWGAWKVYGWHFFKLLNFDASTEIVSGEEKFVYFQKQEQR